jgi:tetratricopeptide (TPR) repeat protein
MTVLTGEQFEQLQHLLMEVLDKRAIKELVRKRLGRRLDTILNPDQSTSEIVFELLTWIDQRGLSTLELVLQGVLAERPGDGALRAFCEQIVPGALKPSDSQPSVKDLFSGAPQPFIGVPPRIASFRGRVDELDRLDAILMRDKPASVTLASVGRVVVHGMGGVGKTALAIEYAHRFRGLYAGVCWCPAETQTGLLTALAGLAVTLGAAAAEEVNLEKAANAALRRLSEQRATWLLVYDNVPAPDAIADLLPSAGARVLLTSRFSDWSELAVDVTLDVLPLEEAVALLQERTRRSDTAGAQTLADALGHLPLALDHAGAYCKRTGVQFADYAKKASSLINAAPRGVGYPKSVAATFDLAIAEAVAQCPGADALMAYLAQCAPERVPMTLVEGAVEDDAERLQALAALAEVSLVKHDPFEDGTPALTVHRLLQVVARGRSDTRGETRRAIDRLIQRLLTIFPTEGYSDPQCWPLCRQLTPHLLAARQAAEPDETLAVVADLLGRLASYFDGRAAYSQAASLLREALAIREKVLGPEHPNTATSLNQLAMLLQSQGELSTAGPLFERALAIREKVLGPEHPATADSFNDLAALLWYKGDLARARTLYEGALKVYEKALGPEHPRTANCLNNLANLLRDQGDLNGARPLHQRALAIREKVLGPEHPDTATSLNNFAVLLRSQDDLAAAQPLFVRALRIQEKTLGTEHPDTATSLSNLANVLQAQGDFAGARPLHQRALAIRENALGSEHPATNRARCNLSRLLLLIGSPTEALTLGDIALTAHHKVLGRDHAWTKDSARITANALDALGRTEEVSALREKYGLTPEAPSSS